LVAIRYSFSGNPNFSFPNEMHLIKNAIFLPNERIVCKPSSSSCTSSGVYPWTLFQYWLEAIGIPEIVKYF